MLDIILSLAGLSLLVLFTEFLWKVMNLHAETARKIVHILSGVFIAFWPLWMSWGEIQIASVILFVAVVVTSKLKIFKSIHGVSRLTRGELLYPVGIGLAAFIAPSTVFFWVAVLNLAVADGIAAMVGQKIGGKNYYSILGHKKSVYGTAAFFITSSIIFTIGVINSTYLDSFSAFRVIILFPLIITAMENISWYGLDNITIPLAVIILLGSL